MELVSEIILVILTVVAWRSGWQWWALLPVGILMSIIVLIALVEGTVIVALTDLLPGKLALDITLTWLAYLNWCACVSLIFMVAKKKVKKEDQNG